MTLVAVSEVATNRPNLRIFRTCEALMVSWRTNFTGYRLLSATDISLRLTDWSIGLSTPSRA
jgi:hypothetical protein